jgi:hypothetical protein
MIPAERNCSRESKIALANAIELYRIYIIILIERWSTVTAGISDQSRHAENPDRCRRCVTETRLLGALRRRDRRVDADARGILIILDAERLRPDRGFANDGRLAT